MLSMLLKRGLKGRVMKKVGVDRKGKKKVIDEKVAERVWEGVGVDRNGRKKVIDERVEGDGYTENESETGRYNDDSKIEGDSEESDVASLDNVSDG